MPIATDAQLAAHSFTVQFRGFCGGSFLNAGGYGSQFSDAGLSVCLMESNALQQAVCGASAMRRCAFDRVYSAVCF